MKRAITITVLLILLVGGYFAYDAYDSRNQAQAASLDLETTTVVKNDLVETIGATGEVRAYQSAILTWQTSGSVEVVEVQVGDVVSAGEVLASLESSSLSPAVILAQVDLVSAQQELDDLLNSSSQQAQALLDVEEAQQALEDALTPELVQANALSAIAYAEKAVDDAQRQLEILTAPPSQSAIDQAYANMLLAENTLNQTLEDIARIERKKKGKMPAFMPLEVQKEIKGAYKDALKALELKRTQDQTRYESAIAKYNNLLMPPDPIDVAEAEAELTTAQAQLAEAQRDWEQVKDGPSPGEIAVLEAQLDDAQREWERLKEGPDPDDVAAAEVRVAAAEAALAQVAVAAPFDGVVTVVGNQPGDKISSGDQAFRVDDVSRFLVDVEVSEIDINQVWIGQEVGVTFEAIPGREYHGEVVEVALVGSEVQGIVSFMTTVELSDPDEAVKPGMTAAVSIVITGRE